MYVLIQKGEEEGDEMVKRRLCVAWLTFFIIPLWNTYRNAVNHLYPEISTHHIILYAQVDMSVLCAQNSEKTGWVYIHQEVPASMVTLNSLTILECLILPARYATAESDSIASVLRQPRGDAILWLALHCPIPPSISHLYLYLYLSPRPIKTSAHHGELKYIMVRGE